MKKSVLGSTGIPVHPLVYGTLPLGPLQANISPEDGGRLIRYALERGVTLFDTATLYETYSHLRAGLAGFGGVVRIATKTHASEAALARVHVEQALRDLGREQLDIVHLHGARLADPFVERKGVFEQLLQLKEEGKIAHVGLSSHFAGAIRKAAAIPEVEVVHPLINRTGMGILDGGPREMAAAIGEAAAAGKGVYGMKALAGGNLIGSARESLQWVRRLPGVQAVAVGMLSQGEIDANLALFEDQDLPADVWTRLETRRRRLRIMDRFCKGCGACVPACTAEGLTVVDGKAWVDEERCILCGYCAAACPEFLIRVV